MSSSATAAAAFSFSPSCLASTGATFCTTTSRRAVSASSRDGRSNLFRQAQFSSDGTTIITQSEDHCLRAFILPQDLLEPREEPQNLQAYSTFTSNSNIQSYAIYPNFTLKDSSTTFVLAGCADVPITLRNALDFDKVQSSYIFQNVMTEYHRPARALAFTRYGTHFIAGGDNIVAAFDCTRHGEGPLAMHKLRPGKGSSQTDTWHLTRKGFVSALSISNEGFLALGTTESEIGIYDEDGLGDCISVFTLDSKFGSGVSDLRWSPDGRYLFVAQRQSDVIDVYDIRGTQQRVAILAGRSAKTSQRLGIDLIQTLSGFEVWAGGTDGHVRMWSNPSFNESFKGPDAQMRLHQAPISSAIWHPTGAVLATSAGKRFDPRALEYSDDGSDPSDSYEISSGGNEKQAPDNTLKVWSV